MGRKQAGRLGRASALDKDWRFSGSRGGDEPRDGMEFRISNFESFASLASTGRGLRREAGMVTAHRERANPAVSSACRGFSPTGMGSEVRWRSEPARPPFEIRDSKFWLLGRRELAPTQRPGTHPASLTAPGAHRSWAALLSTIGPPERVAGSGSTQSEQLVH
jgi:hypothetical protein